jgi:hypothetical protein
MIGELERIWKEEVAGLNEVLYSLSPGRAEGNHEIPETL